MEKGQGMDRLLEAALDGTLADEDLDAVASSGLPEDPDEVAKLVDAIGVSFAERHSDLVLRVARTHPDPVARGAALRVVVRRFGRPEAVGEQIAAIVADPGSAPGLRLTAVQLAGDVVIACPGTPLADQLRGLLSGDDPDLSEAARSALIAAWTPGWRNMTPRERDNLRRSLSPSEVDALGPSGRN